jgi:pimeloyl-ACP methyl ester carboxylesterase
MQTIIEKVANVDSRVWSAGSGNPVVYLHGFENHPGDANFLRRLAESRAVWAPEHPGFGCSGGLDGIVDITDLVLQYRSRIQSWGVSQVDLIGHCLGGMFAAELAALCPQLVRKLVLVSPYGLWLDDHHLPDPFVLNPKALAAAKWFDPETAPSPEPNARYPGEDSDFIRNRNLAAASKFMWPLPDRGLVRRLPFISAPTLVLQGERDGLVTHPHGEAFARLIPNSTLRTIPKAGHLPMFEQEGLFVSEVEQFLA